MDYNDHNTTLRTFIKYEIKNNTVEIYQFQISTVFTENYLFNILSN